MQPHGKFDTGVDAGRNHTAEKKAEPGRSRARPLVARGLAAVLITFAALCALPLQAQAQTIVPNDWSLIPSGLGAGAKFRLLFLSSTKRNGGNTNINTFNDFIKDRAAAGHADIQAYKSDFKVVGCTASRDATVNTNTRGSDTDAPIYWLGGSQVADNYADFYDGSWDDEANDKNELGTDGPNTSNTNNYPYTGCDHDGTEYFDSSNNSRALGTAVVVVGRPNDTGSNNGPISSDTSVTAFNDRPLYGLSPLFQVGPKPDVTISTSSPSEHYSTSHGATFTVTRTGVTTSALTVTVNLRQDKPFLDESELLREVTIAAGSTSKNFSLTGSQLQLPANEPVETGTLTATVEAGPDNNIGAPASASVDIVPFMTVRPEQATYTVLEDVGTFSVKIIARTGNRAAQPSSAFGVSLDTFSDTADFNDDFTPKASEPVTFQPGNFSADGAAWKAVKTVQVTILDDTLEESDEAFEIKMARTPGLDYRILLMNADGTLAANVYTRITIEDDERRPRLTLPPGSIKGVPERHDGVTPFDFTLEFSAAVDFTNAEMAAALQMEARNATVSAKAGDSRRMWTITATPNITNPKYQQIAITIRSPHTSYTGSPAKRCNEAGAICTADGRKLKYSRVVGVQAGGLKPRPPKPLTVGFALPDESSHSTGNLDFQLIFSEPLANAPRTGDAAARLAWWKDRMTYRLGATLTAVSYIGDDGLDVGREVWRMRIVISDTGNALTTGVTVPKFTGGCTASNALCTAAETNPNDRRKLNRSLYVPIRCGGSPCSGTPPVSPQVEADPLTAAFSNVPDSHDGSTAFTFRLTFSEDVDISAADLKDHALTVTNGAVTTALALNSGTAEWDITLQPTGAGSLNILVSPTSDCAATGALCTAAGTMLSTVPGRSIPYADAVAPQPQVQASPLTAGFTSVPAEHDGETAFKLRIAFSEGISISFRTFRDASLSVSGGSVTKAKRVDRRKDLWEATVKPGSIGDVTVTLEGGRACGTPGAVCTGDGRVLSATISTRVLGPPGLSVADATVQEGAGAQLDFVVSLSRVATGTVTVDYLTRDGTAIAGQDYTATSGTLTFAAGETTGTVAVPVLDDAHDEGSETMKLKLSNASGARITDRKAIGTITNSGPLQRAWLSRFGRTVAEQVLDAVGARVEGNSNSPGPAQLTLGGHRVVLGASWPGAEETLLGQDLRDVKDLFRAEADASPVSEISTAGFLMASSLHLASADGGKDDARWSLWARGSRSSFSGREDALTLEGDVSTGVMGADYERGRVLAGVAIAYSTGEGSYTEADARGEVESTLLSAYPYLRYTLSERLSVWGVLGLGEGGLTLDMKANENANDERIETDVSLAMAAFGTRGKLLSVAGYDLAVKTDVLLVRTESEAATGLAAADARTRRLRVTLEGSREIRFGADSVLTPSLEIGLRHDGGDAETGSGLELGGGLRWAGLKGFSVEVRARGLLAHEERDYEEWGVSASIGLSPGEGDRGLSMRVGSAWGAASGGVERLWSQRALTGGSFDPDARLDAEVGYGLDAMRGLLTPYTGVALSEGGETWRARARFRLGPALELNLEASLTEPDGDGETGSGLVLRGTKRW